MAQATLNGLLTADGGLPCTVSFEWGLTASYGKMTPYMQGFRVGNTFSYLLKGLNEGTVYHYRAIAQNSRVVVYGADVTFVTPEGEHMMTLLPQELAFMLESG